MKDSGQNKPVPGVVSGSGDHGYAAFREIRQHLKKEIRRSSGSILHKDDPWNADLLNGLPVQTGHL
jgi:hypothetical protein